MLRCVLQDELTVKQPFAPPMRSRMWSRGGEGLERGEGERGGWAQGEGEVQPVVTLLRHSSGSASAISRLAAHPRTSCRLRRVFSPNPSSLVTGSSKQGISGFKLPLERIVVTCRTGQAWYSPDPVLLCVFWMCLQSVMLLSVGFQALT